ncbi:hypothetical protein TNCV_3597061 [Trichonephila clavipes]|nr:hypothetical protein TNCV_3597061 [Trichonephila clavipes]
MLVGLLLRSCFLIGGHGRRQWAGRTGAFRGLRKNQVQVRASRREARLLLVVRSREECLTTQRGSGDPGRDMIRTLHAPQSWRHLSIAKATKPSNNDANKPLLLKAV